jgi:hypothetical protein
MKQMGKRPSLDQQQQQQQGGGGGHGGGKTGGAGVVDRMMMNPSSPPLSPKSRVSLLKTEKKSLFIPMNQQVDLDPVELEAHTISKQVKSQE